jgi:hypothetical protein
MLAWSSGASEMRVEYGEQSLKGEKGERDASKRVAHRVT